MTSSPSVTESDLHALCPSSHYLCLLSGTIHPCWQPDLIGLVVTDSIEHFN